VASVLQRNSDCSCTFFRNMNGLDNGLHVVSGRRGSITVYAVYGCHAFEAAEEPRELYRLFEILRREYVVTSGT
jgi:hypothetical protein